MTPVPPPATQSPVDVATVRFTVGLLADFFACNGNKTLASGLREAAALAALPPQQQDEQECFDLAAHLRRQRYWSHHTFGPGDRAKGVVAHIRKELIEIEANPGDVEEWIDVVILALDGAWRSGASPTDIIDTLVRKQVKNEAREWPDWRTADPDGPIEHVKAEQPAPVREWGVRHGDDCRLNHGQMRPGTYATREAAEEGAQYIKGRGLCIPVVVSRTPGGVWEPAEEETEDTLDNPAPDPVRPGWADVCNGVAVEPTPDRFSVAEIEAAWDRSNPNMPLTGARLLAALRAAANGEG